MNFDHAFELVVGLEGNYSNNPADPGGETKYGISKRAHPSEDIANMTLERAKQIYLNEYWGPAGCDAMPDLLKSEMFDTAVLHGPKTAIKLLQRAIGAMDDGVIGPKTLLALSTINPIVADSRLMGHRLAVETDSPVWADFGRGWARRIATKLTDF